MNARTVIVNCGVSRSGKSTFALRYCCNADLAFRFIFDPDFGPQSYAERLRCESAGTPYEMDMQLLQGWVLFNPHLMFPGRLAAGFNYFCDWVYLRSRKLPGAKLLVIDEAWKYLNPHRYPEEAAQCVQSGAAYELQCMFNTQTPHKLPEAISNECSELVCFKLGGEKSLAFVQGKGLDPREVEALPQLSYVARNIDSGGELRGRIEL